MSSQGLAELRRLVYANPGLALRLRRLPADALTPALLQLAAEHDIHVDAGELDAAAAAGARDWALRWAR
jgi:hypothetical protein